MVVESVMTTRIVRGQHNDTFSGRLLNEACRDCGHLLAVHNTDYSCNLCQLLIQFEELAEALKAEVRAALDTPR
jgi:ribosomal protein S27AE